MIDTLEKQSIPLGYLVFFMPLGARSTSVKNATWPAGADLWWETCNKCKSLVWVNFCYLVEGNIIKLSLDDFAIAEGAF